MKKWICALGLLMQVKSLCAWNAMGHQLIAQIAYKHLKPHTRKICNRYNHALDEVYRPQTLVRSAVWLDELKFQDFNWFNHLHFVKGYFSKDNTPLPEEPARNAVYAIHEAMRVLKKPQASLFHKGIALRILLHVVGDIHQPLHTASKVSAQFPAGDLGGNLFPLGVNPVANNLHGYWDKGAGYLVYDNRQSAKSIASLAAAIGKKWPCKLQQVDINPAMWVTESHKLAVEFAYQVQKNEKPSPSYQLKAQQITEKRLALAGCRLAALLNYIDRPASNKVYRKKA